MKNALHRLALTTTLTLGLAGGAAAVASAQAAPGPLPTAPGADRAANGGLSMAHTSLPGAPGASPLEPYLVTWLLPVGGLLTVLIAGFVDKRTQSAYRR